MFLGKGMVSVYVGTYGGRMRKQATQKNCEDVDCKVRNLQCTCGIFNFSRGESQPCHLSPWISPCHS